MTAFSFLIGLALKTSAVLAAAWLATWLLRQRSAALRHLVWTAAVAAVLALPLLSLILPAVRMPAGARLLALVPNITFQTGSTAAAPDSPQLPNIAQRRNRAPAHSPIDWRLFAVLLWAAGTLVGVARMAAAIALIARARRRAHLHPAQAESVSLANSIGLDRAVNVLAAPAGSMPMTCGIFRPVVFLPSDAAAWDAERLRVVLLHELAHVRRGDAAAHLLARLALALHWWNPLAWLAWRESLKDRERAADDLVLLAGERPSAYAGHLLDVARALHSRPPVAWGALAMARRSQLEGRLLAILDPQLPRHSVARVSALAAAMIAIATVAPFAAMRAQEPPVTPLAAIHRQDSPVPPAASAQVADTAVQPAIGLSALELAAKQFAKYKQTGTSKRLLDAALALPEDGGKPHDEVLAEGLVAIADLARFWKQYDQAADFYRQAVADVAGKPASARPLMALGAMALAKKDYSQALDYFQKAQAADPDHSGMPLTWTAIAYTRDEKSAVLAEPAFQQAMAAEDPASADAATTLECYATFLKLAGRDAEGNAASQKALSIRKALGAQGPARVEVAPGAPAIYRVGRGVTAPQLLSKQEPEYTEDARVAKYQGTAVLYVEVGPDGAPHNIRITRDLGFGLGENAVDAVSQWKFAPGTKDGVPVTVAATIEVNFRLL